MNALKLEQQSSSNAVQAKERELQKIQVGTAVPLRAGRGGIEGATV